MTEERLACKTGGGSRLLLLVACSVGIACALLSMRASAAPSNFVLTFEGSHIDDLSLPAGLRHDGRFTASTPFCLAGRAYDVRQFVDEAGYLAVWRLHTCDDGSGSFTAFMPAVRGEHGGTDGWSIVEGTGSYATLRGVGTYTGALVSGDPDNFASIVYRTQWQGRVDFDVDPPATVQFTASARKLDLKRRTYSLRVTVIAQDPSAPIQFNVEVKAGQIPLAAGVLKTAPTAPERASTVLRLSPPSRARAVQVALVLTDAVGNSSTSSHSVALRP